VVVPQRLIAASREAFMTIHVFLNGLLMLRVVLHVTLLSHLSLLTLLSFALLCFIDTFARLSAPPPDLYEDVDGK
jgi:hypothetical protein